MISTLIGRVGLFQRNLQCVRGAQWCKVTTWCMISLGSIPIKGPLKCKSGNDSRGVSCSAFGRAHGLTGHQINPSWWTYWAVSRFIEFSLLGKVCAVLLRRRSSVLECMLMVQWVIRSIPHGGPIELFLVSSSFPFWVRYVLFCLEDVALC